jgi:uncharacterized protein (DUF934 family)
MPLLDRNGLAEDPFTRVETTDIEGLGPVIVPWAHHEAALARRGDNQPVGVEIPNTVSVAELRPVLDRFALVAVQFPSFADGRGFSLARQIRREGFAGTLRAAGPLIADQFADALNCGFDQVEIPEDLASRQPPEHWRRALAAISSIYQRGYGEGASILDQRRAARLREASDGR